MAGFRTRALSSWPPRNRRQGVRHALLHTLPGRAIVIGLAARSLVYGIQLAHGSVPAFFAIVDTVASAALALGAP